MTQTKDSNRNIIIEFKNKKTEHKLTCWLHPDETKLATSHKQHLLSHSFLLNIPRFSPLQKDEILPSIKPEAIKRQLVAFMDFQKKLAERIHYGTSQMMMALMVDKSLS
ncbi:hypothetical protein CIPAW_05G258700 [Carya illinoinensis]|uniref:Uncharacterized protein n=1 Tax=Carya illinoinensis TaxID=32201 RepID=A0A8T1QPJ5_CARIL|nr:hypothetical protein CIPAW_05G258700 [Carya illinoinensis]